MPDLTVVVSGVGTEVGKTWFGARTLTRLAATGIDVSARKPVQSFDLSNGGTDAEILASATGEPVEQICPRHRWYELPLAPPMAALELGRDDIYIADLLEEMQLPPDGVVLVEGVGGPRSPLASDGDTVALARALEADLVVVVARPGLGAINDVLLCREAFAGFDVVVAFNRFDPADAMHARNLTWLRSEEGAEVVTSPEELADRLERLMMEA